MSDPRRGKPLEEITDTPALLVDVDVLEANIEALQTYCDAHAIALWPHAKTHKCSWIAARQLARGAHGLTCAKATAIELLLSSGVEAFFWRIAADRRCQVVACGQPRRPVRAVDHAGLLRGGQGLSDAARRTGVTIDVLVELDAGLRVGVTARTRPSPSLTRSTASQTSGSAGSAVIQAIYVRPRRSTWGCPSWRLFSLTRSRASTLQVSAVTGSRRAPR